MTDKLLITRLPTLVNIEGMNLEELRQQYKLLESDAIHQAQQLGETCMALHRINKIAHDYAMTFGALCDSFEAGDQAAILLLVKKLSEASNGKRARVH